MGDLWLENSQNDRMPYWAKKSTWKLQNGSRHRCRTANTSTACCTRTRWLVESLFARESHLSLLGARSEIPNQYLNPCGIPNYESQTTLMVWLQIGDSLLNHHATPYSYKYGTVDTYLDHANDMKRRMELENPLSAFSGVTWSRNDIFSRPLGLHPRTLNGQPITRVNLFDQQQTGLPPVTPDELSSVTLGSYQQRLVRSYVTSLRWLTVTLFLTNQRCFARLIHFSIFNSKLNQKYSFKKLFI